jgi:hypothetical protein
MTRTARPRPSRSAGAALALASGALGVLSIAGCGTAEVPTVLAPPTPGLSSDPRWLTFTCVRPGCDTKLSATIKVVGGRDLAVKRIIVSDRDRTDITVEAGRSPPFILRATETFAITARYVPTGDPRLGDVNVLVTYTDASASEGEDRVMAGELEIPIVRRLVGEPTMEVSPLRLDFGPVLPGTRKTLPLRVRNAGFGNVGLVLEQATSNLPEFSVAAPPAFAILPMGDHDLDVTFAPTEEQYSEGFVTIRSADPSAPTPEVRVIGTSIPRPSLLLQPDRGVDFGEVPRAMAQRATFRLVNQGALPLTVSNVEIVNAGAAEVTLRLPRGLTSTVVEPLASLTGTVTLSAMRAGPVDARLRVTSDDPQRGVAELPIVALITEPSVEVGPVTIDWGTVPRGWVQTRSIEILNRGYGDLLINGVNLLVGSSELFTLQRPARLPVRLRHAERIAVQLEFRAEAEAAFNGTVSIETNDATRPSVEVPLTARGASCDAGCPVTNGVPTCANGVCAIASCNAGFYDTDAQASNGCECAEVGSDPASFCSDAPYLGTLSDEGGRANQSGIIATADDVDFFRFFGYDESQFFSDDFDVRINLQSGDPDIVMCVYQHRTSQHESACILEGERCNIRDYREDGSFGSDDSADFSIKVYRRTGSAPSCVGYTVFMSNG